MMNMPTYPSYYPNMIGQQNYNPYIPYQQQTTSLNGKIVDNIESISANDVPMDGSTAVFPKRDLSEVYVKYWTANGEIKTIRFCPVLDTSAQKTSVSTGEGKQPDFGAFFDELKVMEDKVDGLIESLKTKRSRRDVDNE